VDRFVHILEEYLDVEKTNFSMMERWQKCSPPEAMGKSLPDFLVDAMYNPNMYDCYHQYDNFREDHQKKFCKEAYVSPYMAKKWELGSQVTLEEKEQALRDTEIFRAWFARNVLEEDSETASDAIIVLPSGKGEPWYRDLPLEVPHRGPGYTAMALAALLALPQLVIPIGQIPYDSRITGNVAYLPVAASIAGASGSDLMIMNLAEAALNCSGWPTEVETGNLTFKLGDNDRNVASVRTPEFLPLYIQDKLPIGVRSSI